MRLGNASACAYPETAETHQQNETKISLWATITVVMHGCRCRDFKACAALPGRSMGHAYISRKIAWESIGPRFKDAARRFCHYFPPDKILALYQQDRALYRFHCSPVFRTTNVGSESPCAVRKLLSNAWWMLHNIPLCGADPAPLHSPGSWVALQNHSGHKTNSTPTSPFPVTEMFHSYRPAAVLTTSQKAPACAWKNKGDTQLTPTTTAGSEGRRPLARHPCPARLHKRCCNR